MKKSQAWSMDIMMAFVIFVGTIFVFYSIINNRQTVTNDELKDDASRVLENLNITQDISQIDELLKEDYLELKRRLRIKNDFCIYLEDEEGNIININPDDEDQLGIGSGKIYIGDKPCK